MYVIISYTLAKAKVYGPFNNKTEAKTFADKNAIPVFDYEVCELSKPIEAVSMLEPGMASER